MIPKKSKDSEVSILAEERSRTAFTMRAEGYTVKEIAKELNVHEQTVYLCLKRGHKIFTNENSEAMKDAFFSAMQNKLRQCEDLYKNAKDKKIKLQAFEQYRKFLQDMAKLTGVNEASKLDVTSGGEPILRLKGKEWDTI